jgi:hypothetical protein
VALQFSLQVPSVLHRHKCFIEPNTFTSLTFTATCIATEVPALYLRSIMRTPADMLSDVMYVERLSSCQGQRAIIPYDGATAGELIALPGVLGATCASPGTNPFPFPLPDDLLGWAGLPLVPCPIRLPGLLADRPTCPSGLLERVVLLLDALLEVVVLALAAPFFAALYASLVDLPN